MRPVFSTGATGEGDPPVLSVLQPWQNCSQPRFPQLQLSLRRVALCSWPSWEITGLPLWPQFYLGNQLPLYGSCPLYSSCHAVSLGSHSCPPGWDRWSRGVLSVPSFTQGLSEIPGRLRAQDPLRSVSPFHIPGEGGQLSCPLRGLDKSLPLSELCHIGWAWICESHELPGIFFKLPLIF